MVHHTRLIILNTTKIGERSLVLHALSPDWGRRSFVAAVPKGGGMALFQPLSVLDAEIVENPKSDLWRAHALSASHPLAGIRTSPAKNAMTLFMSEVLYRTVRDGACEAGLFDWCERSILTLDALAGDYANYHLRFLLEFAAALGFSPSLEDLMPFADTHLEELRTLLQADFGTCMLLPLNGASRNEIAELLLRYIGYHTETRIEARSLRVLRELFR
ncbi:MAG: DNA repair protein RecO C-terminal domain-containing protein [Bacteroidales bacterium]|jgi:DNA repair protein RecO (recombination protein O)|nr:DNA repair protein RecO C-terminal domain-containing protein [Bacteroidales bacterium]